MHLDTRHRSRHAWNDGPGWAPDGQAHLLLDGLTTSKEIGICSPQEGVPARSVTLTPEGGDPVEPLAIVNFAGAEMIQIEGEMIFHAPVWT